MNRLVLVGDVNCTDDQGHVVAIDSAVAAELERADVRLGNLEGAFYDSTDELPYKPGWLNCKPDALRHVIGRFDGVACANNVHYGAAISASNAALDQAGLPHVGAGENLAAARRPAVVKRGDVTIGMLAYTSVFWPIGQAATEVSPGVATVRVNTSYEPNSRVFEMPGAPAITHTVANSADCENVRSDISSLRTRVDFVVVYFHWGVTGSSEVAEYQQQLGRLAIDCGATVVAGSHPHVPQGVEFWRDGVIFYSLGNFTFGWREHREYTRDGIIGRVDFADGRIIGCSAVPISRDESDEVLRCPADSIAGARIAEMLNMGSARFGTSVEQKPDGLWFSPVGG